MRLFWSHRGAAIFSSARCTAALVPCVASFSPPSVRRRVPRCVHQPRESRTQNPARCGRCARAQHLRAQNSARCGQVPRSCRRCPRHGHRFLGPPHYSTCWIARWDGFPTKHRPSRGPIALDRDPPSMGPCCLNER